MCYLFLQRSDRKSGRSTSCEDAGKKRLGRWSTPIYEIEHQGRRLAFYHPGIGSAIAAATLEEAIGFGCRKFIACGGCGVLAPDIAVGQLVVLSGAIRDEGASYHYLPPAREVIANPLGVYTLVDMLKTTESLIWLGKTLDDGWSIP